jgi:hypothetical protein
MAWVFFGVFMTIGLLDGFGESGFPPRNGSWEVAVVIFGLLGSMLLWMWLAFLLQRPLADIMVSGTGLVVHNIKAKESRYLWANPELRLILSHSLADETAPFHTPDTEWRIQLRPPASSGMVPEACYQFLTETARSVGFSTVDRKYFVSTKGGGFWMVETAVRPINAPR